MKTLEEYEKEYEEKYKWKGIITLAEYIYSEWLKEDKITIINNFYCSKKDDKNV